MLINNDKLMATVHIANMLNCSYVNGPGTRAVIWVQGCSLKCAGCWNPNTHRAPNNYFDNTQKNIKHIIDFVNLSIEQYKIEGITISGGEPMQQKNIVDLVTCLKESTLKGQDLSIGMYSGYYIEELEQMNNWIAIKDRLDFVVAGRFDINKIETKKSLISSSNQKLILLSDRYNLNEFPEPGEVEFQITDGLVELTGFPVGIHARLLNSLTS